MSRVPETGPTRESLLWLVDQLRQALASPPSPERCRELVAQLNDVGELGNWCRGAGLALARLTDPPLTWQEMEKVTGVSDATLHDRFRRWEQKEGGGSG